MPTIYIIVCAIVFQLTAAILAIRLIRITGKSVAWLLISIALVLMTSRRVITFCYALTEESSIYLDLINESIGLVLSFIMMLGILKIAPVIFSLKKSEIELKKISDKFSKIFNSGSIAITLSNLLDESYIDVNESFLQLVGREKKDVLGHSALDLEIYLDSGKNKELFQALHNNMAIRNYEMPICTKSGNIIETLASFENVIVDNKKCVITSIIDITKQKIAERKAQRLTNLYQTLNCIDHAIIGVRKPQELFQKVCNEVIKYAGFYFTWIGFLDERTGKVNPVANAGFENGYLKEINITDRDNDPIGVSVREERTIICEDIENDALMETWKLLALEKGYRSSASIPLRLRGNVAYVIILYSNESYFFTLDQLQLLEEIGTHISFTLDALELEVERNQAEEVLRKNETRYRFLIENQSDLISHYRSDTILTFANEAYCNFYGKKHDEVIGKSFLSMVAPEYHEQVFNEIESILDNNKPIKGEYLNYKHDGEECWIQWIVQGIDDGNYNVTEIQAVGRDITERKRFEEALRESENKYHSLIENLNEGIFISDERGSIQFANKELARIHGYNSPQEMLNRNFRDFIEPSMKENLENNISKAKEAGVFSAMHDLIIIKPDGSFADIQVKPSPVYRGEKIIGVMGVVQDITERKKAEEAIRRSAELYKITFENTGTASILIEEDKTLSLVNKEFENLSGYSKIEIEGKKKWTEFVVNEDLDRMSTLHKMRREDAANVPNQYEFQFIDRSGNIHDILLFVDIIKGTKTSVASLLDITERKKMEEQLRQMQKMEGLGTLAGGISHDFNNILGIILAYITTLKKYKNDERKLDRAIETVIKAVDRGKMIVRQILTFAHQTKTAFESMNVNDVVEEIMTMVTETFPKVIIYSNNLDRTIPNINADKSQLYQALLNLCVNARDAMTHGGMLTLNTRLVSVIGLRSQHPDASASSYICIEVIDTGDGMTEEIRRRIFEPFFTTKELGKGTGLGLSVVFGVVQSHKGYIDVESELGKGTKFKIYLPTSLEAESVSEKENGESEDISGGTETVLIVEDEETLMMSLQMILVENGYNVLFARDGLEALKVYHENKGDIALVLTDLGLPTMTGLELCKLIKKIKSDEKMILATGFIDGDTKSEFLKAGIQYFLYKPYDPKKVLKMIREVLDKK